MLSCSTASFWTIAEGEITVLGGYDARSRQTIAKVGPVLDLQLCRIPAGLGSGEPLVCSDVAADERFGQLNGQAAASKRVAAMMFAPISANAQVIGALCAEEDGRQRVWSASDRTKLKRLAAAAALHAAR